jgi:hypothetical protein
MRKTERAQNQRIRDAENRRVRRDPRRQLIWLLLQTF